MSTIEARTCLSIKDLPTTLQGVFDAAIERLYNGQGQAFHMGRCHYRLKRRSQQTIACVVGYLMPEELYAGRFEAHNVLDYMFEDPKYPPVFRYCPTLRMLRALQQIHDQLESWEGDYPNEYARAALRILADTYNLQTDKLEQRHTETQARKET